MEVKIGVQNVAREIVLDSDQTPEAVTKLVAAALQEQGLLTLADSKGRVVAVPVSALAYVDIGPERRGGVGFGSI